jgi:hypothetical protein
LFDLEDGDNIGYCLIGILMLTLLLWVIFCYCMPLRFNTWLTSIHSMAVDGHVKDWT